MRIEDLSLINQPFLRVFLQEGSSELSVARNKFIILKTKSGHKYVTLEHKTSHKSLGYICSNSQQYTVWVKIIYFSFMPKIIRILSKDHVP